MDQVSDPECLPQWWPGVQRVEDASRGAWTTVLVTPKGRTLRADFTLLDSDHPRLLRWRQEVEESPFERILSDAVTELEMEPAGEGETSCGSPSDSPCAGSRASAGSR